MTLSPALKIELLREILPEGWEIVRSGDGPSEEPMDEEMAAAWLKTTIWVLRRHRTNGTGPLFRRVGKNPVYRRSDLQDWLDSLGAKRSLSEFRETG